MGSAEEPAAVTGESLAATGERLVPDLQDGELVHAEHLARYLMAAQLAPGKAVLDAACGEGYGTAMLAAAGATRAVGVDIDPASVEHARARYGLQFEIADVAELPFEAGEFDLIVSFETIEHVSDPECVLDEFRRALAPDGLLVVSTPNKTEYLDENEFHTREFTSEEFSELLRGRFDAVDIRYQQNWLASAVLDEDQLAAQDAFLNLDVYKTNAVERGHELYAIAVCGSGDRSALRDIAVTTGVHEAYKLAADIRAWQDRAAVAERQVRPWQERAAFAERQVGAWEERSAVAERQVGAWEERAAVAERQVEAWEDRAAVAEQQASEARETIERIRQSLSWRMTRPLRSLKSAIRRT